MEPKTGEKPDDLAAGLRGRLSGNQRPDAVDVGSQLRQLRQLMKPRLGDVSASSETPRKSRRRSRSLQDTTPFRAPSSKTEAVPAPRHRPRGPRRIKPRSPWRRRLPIVFIAGAILCLVVAFAQVRLHRQVTTGTVVLAVDVSRSMKAADVEPNRLSAALDAARAFLQSVPPGFRVGLVTFATQSTVVVPPTADHSRLLGALTALSTPSEVGTVIGDGLSTAIQAIQSDRGEHGDRPSAVVLLTDGRDSGSVVAPDQAADRARQLGIPIFTVGIAQPSAPGAISASGASSPDLLRQIASTTGAKSFTTSSADQLTQVYASLGSRLSYELAVGDNAGPFVIAAVLLTLFAVVMVLHDLRDPYAQPSPSKRPRHR